MAFDLDFCLSCDQHTVDGPYCSQSCRLADLEKGGSFDTEYPSPPTPSFQKSVSSEPYKPTHSSRFHLLPALDFSSSRSPAASSSKSTKNNHNHTTSTSTSTSDGQATISRSSSSSSCTSTPTSAPATSSRPTQSSTIKPTSTNSQPSSQPSSPSRPKSHMSESAQRELRHYESLFDQSRHRHRRSSLSYT